MSAFPAVPVYDIDGAYDRLLLEYHFDGQTDEELLATHLDRITDGRPLTVLELGCGTGRMTTVLLGHSSDLICVEPSDAMLAAFRRRHPHLDPMLADARTAVDDLASRKPSAAFDLVAAFWSLNYPLLSCFETNDGQRITPLEHTTGLSNAHAFLHQLMTLVAPGGHLLAFFFDTESAEQRLVTRLWERIAPFPGTGRDYTRTLLLDTLQTAHNAGAGTLHHHHVHGYAGDASPQAARDYILRQHLRGFPGLADAPEIQTQVAAFVDEHTASNGIVRIPAGMHLIDWHRA